MLFHEINKGRKWCSQVQNVRHVVLVAKISLCNTVTNSFLNGNPKQKLTMGYFVGIHE